MTRTDDELRDATWLVTLDTLAPTKITAAYHHFTDVADFIEFKNAQHKLVYTVAASHVVSIKRVTEETKDQAVVEVHNHIEGTHSEAALAKAVRATTPYRRH